MTQAELPALLSIPLWWKERLSTIDAASREGNAVWAQHMPPLPHSSPFSGTPSVRYLQWPSCATCCGDPAAVLTLPTLAGAVESCPGSM